MDRATLLEHRERWGREPKPTRARLAHLTGAEGALYDDLVEDVLGPAVRLEQKNASPGLGQALHWLRSGTDARRGGMEGRAE